LIVTYINLDIHYSYKAYLKLWILALCYTAGGVETLFIVSLHPSHIMSDYRAVSVQWCALGRYIQSESWT